ncbi:hypothetical protein HD806DRAFT_527644 [Xylariaceae sp. AK1471]|nr:hypothetical protein HD806DRAFT_527644 [Xylariaceae sp. AK1471]
MAFHQPTRQTAQRVFRPAVEDEEPHHPQLPVTQPIEESQTWVLFSPATDAGTTASYLTSTHKSNITLGRSRLSDLGSFNTFDRSEASAEHQQHSDSFINAVEEEEEDDAELDSLDSHLPEFRSTPDFYISSEAAPHATPVVPAHDGLGSFRLEQEGMGSDVQNRLYALEQYNPRRIKRRRESLDLARVELEREETQEIDKIRRIETWRLEQSRYLLDEIQKETRRRRRSVASMSNTHPIDQRAEDSATLSAVGGAAERDRDEEWHDQNLGDSSEGRDSIWGRITRKVIRDIMGIDDKMLSILFGEALPDEEDLSTTPKASVLPSSRLDDGITSDTIADSGWQIKLLERVAKELGHLVHQLSEHPGAFSTFSRMQQMPIPYAGLPAIPERANNPVASDVHTGTHEITATIPEFQPTIPTSSRPIDVPQARHPSGSTHGKPQLQTDNGTAFTQDEWEQDLDIRLVFRYLRSRFLSRSSGTSSGLSGTSHLATSSSQDVAAKAARVRQHHPLISRSRNVPIERRKSKATAVSNPALFRPASSCASQSTRRSVRRSSCSSSRHYWDIGGSVGTGSMIATTGPMGSWGEV